MGSRRGEEWDSVVQGVEDRRWGGGPLKKDTFWEEADTHGKASRAGKLQESCLGSHRAMEGILASAARLEGSTARLEGSTTVQTQSPTPYSLRSDSLDRPLPIISLLASSHSGNKLEPGISLSPRPFLA